MTKMSYDEEIVIEKLRRKYLYPILIPEILENRELYHRLFFIAIMKIMKEMKKLGY